MKLSEIIAKQAIINFGTIGSIAAGKSTIVRDLTGKKTQRHSSEQTRNITIHLGYANCKIFLCEKTGKVYPSPSDTEILYSPDTNDPMKLISHISFVDCPGHENYMATMIGGTSVMDSCLLLIASNEPVPMPQTLDHLLTINHTDIRDVLILQNKIDLLEMDDLLKNYDNICEFVKNSPFENNRIIPVSAQMGWNIGEICKYLTHMKPKKLDLINEPARMTILRSFDVNYPNIDLSEMNGGVVGGSISQGNFQIGDIVEIRPGITTKTSSKPLIAKITTLHSETTPLEMAVPGGLIGIGLSLDPSLAKNNALIGQMIGHIGTLPEILTELTLKVHRLKPDQNLPKFSINEKLIIVINNNSVNAEIIQIHDSKRKFEIKLAHPICTEINTKVSVFRKIEHKFKLYYSGEIIDYLSIEPEYNENYNLYQNVPRHVEIEDDLTHATTEILNYHDLLDIKMKTNIRKDPLRIITPELINNRKITIWNNFEKVINSIVGKEENPFETDYCKNKILSTITDKYSFNGENQLMIRGKLTLGNINISIREYLKNYKCCWQCKGFNTQLKKDKYIQIHCKDCTSIKTV